MVTLSCFGSTVRSSVKFQAIRNHLSISKEGDVHVLGLGLGYMCGWLHSSLLYEDVMRDIANIAGSLIDNGKIVIWKIMSRRNREKEREVHGDPNQSCPYYTNARIEEGNEVALRILRENQIPIFDVWNTSVGFPESNYDGSHLTKCAETEGGKHLNYECGFLIDKYHINIMMNMIFN